VTQTGADTAAGERPGRIDAVPVRHPGRWVGLVIVLILVGMLISSFVTNDSWNWSFTFRVMQQKSVINGLLHGTLLGTAGAMVVGVVLGVILAVLRLSPNPILKLTSGVYIWFFRAIPRYVLLLIFGNIGVLYATFHIGPPFAGQLLGLFGVHNNLTLFNLDANQISSGIVAGILGLGLSEAAYMAEIARAGINSVDRGQTEAAQALGMSRGQTMRRIVLPQAMRVIIPPTGNETIAMVKDTSLLIALPVINELTYQTSAIGGRTFQLLPSFIAASIYYLIIGSLLGIVQYFLERRFGKGFGLGQGGR
jgi:polar amino acid transport system permease protein